MMAPDGSSATAGKKLAATRHWKNLGQNAQALWGECQGSALYQVRVDLSSLTLQCSCPSRKQPCKHGLGLLFLAAEMPDAVPDAEPPEWVVTWLTKRGAATKRKETQAARVAADTPAPKRTKTVEKRQEQVSQGIERLDLWLNDLIRNGLGSVETQPARFWESQAAQMVDAKAPGLASRLRHMASIPNSSPQWTEKLLGQLGQLALLSQAFRRLDQLAPDLQEDIRQLIGWTLQEGEVLARGERVSDDWCILGQCLEEVERGRSQRIWLRGAATGRCALIQQFAPPGAAFSRNYVIGVRQQADLVYWPGAAPQRAWMAQSSGEARPLREGFPAVETIEAFFADITRVLVHQPWRDRFLCTIHDVIPSYDTESRLWYIRDTRGNALPLTKGEHWKLLACSGGRPLDFAGEWNGETLLPLGVLTDQTYYML